MITRSPARLRGGDASGRCNGRLDADESRARQKLQQCPRPLAGVLTKIRSNYGRRVIPPDLAAMLACEADGVANDLRAARKSLACPPGSAVGRAD